MNDCSVCYETLNLQNHKKVSCPFCDFEACRTCIQRYLLDSANDPHCMKCKHTWNREFVDQSCTKVFRNKDLKLHRENILLEREKSYLPETQEAAKREKQKRSINERMNEVQKEIQNQTDLLRDLAINLEVLNRDQTLPEGGDKKTRFVRKCPIENCKGFLSSQWKCELCENSICSQCNEEKKDNHECDPNSVETLKLLKKDTKPCPTCGTLINKESGCSQMWCPSCHTAFNWNTGRIETGVIHNPHFYDYQRKNGGNLNPNRNVGDIPCGGIPEISELNVFFDKITIPTRRHYNHHRYNYQDASEPKNLSEDERLVYDSHRLVVHIEQVELRWNFREIVINNKDLRVKYLLNEIIDEDFKKIIQQREKKTEKIKDIINILRMFSLTISDMLRQLVLKQLTLDNYCEEISNLKIYTNENLRVIGKRYNSKQYFISKEWEFY